MLYMSVTEHRNLMILLAALLAKHMSESKNIEARIKQFMHIKYVEICEQKGNQLSSLTFQNLTYNL